MAQDISIVPVTEADFDEWLAMALELWPEHEPNELRQILRDLLISPKEEAFLCRASDGSPAGFINLSTRTDYVEGAETSPVGFIEGIFVREHLRNTGVARSMVEFGERWATKKGYKELASDTELDNTSSQRFHEAVGFKEGGRVVVFVKRVGPGRD